MSKKIDIDLLREFRIRVYGILTLNNKYLVSYESYQNKNFVKFPGGGLELGESTLNCLKREFKQELNIEIEVGNHIYTCENVVQNSFNKSHQVLGVYYHIHTSVVDFEKIQSSLNQVKIDDNSILQNRAWIKKDELTNILTFEMDKEAANRL